MKKYMTIAALVVMTGISGLTAVKADPAQQNGYGGGRIERLLNLTDVQKAELKPLLSGVHQQVQMIRADASLSAEQKTQKLQALRRQTKVQIDQILTPAQQQQLQAIREQRRQAWLARHRVSTPL